MTSRRELLRSLGAVAGLSWFGMLARPTPALAAVPVMAVVAVVNTALTISRLLSSSSGSIGDLLHLQTQMLQAISAQLVVIQRGIEEILSRLTAIEELIGKLPAEVVNELFRRRLNGLLGTYGELMETYQADVAKDGLAAAQKRMAEELESELLKPLREVRSVLFTSPNHLNIPLLSASLQVEVHGMIMAGYRSARIAPALSRYRDWFMNAARTDTTSVASRVAALRDKRRDASAELAKLTDREECVAAKNRVGPPIPIAITLCESEGGGEFFSLKVEFSDYGYVQERVPLAELESSVQELVDKKLLDDRDLPATVGLAPPTPGVVADARGCFNGKIYSSNPGLLPAHHEAVRRYFQSGRSCGAQPRAIGARAKELSAFLENSGYSVITLAALEAAADSSIAGIDAFQRDLGVIG